VSRAPKIMKPDVMVFDLDPSDDDLSRLKKGALTLRALLDELGLESWVKTSGSKGYHIAVPLDAKSDYGKVATFAHAVGGLLIERDAKNFTREFYKKDREGKIFIDTGRNEYSATFAATYAVRPRPKAPVSAPITWDELKSGKFGPTSLTVKNVPKRVAKVGDLWAELLETRQALPAV
jgi:bifunctional non-homologous end joining protein LigD